MPEEFGACKNKTHSKGNSKITSDSKIEDHLLPEKERYLGQGAGYFSKPLGTVAIGKKIDFLFS